VVQYFQASFPVSNGKGIDMKTQRGEERREKILRVAEAIILRKGFAATSIEDIMAGAHITKGGFFYHFPGKSELARALVERYLVQDANLFDGLAERAAELTEDPLQQWLLFLNLLAETMANLEDLHPGCLVASFTYESAQLDDDVKALIAEGLLRWRQFFRQQLERAAAAYAMDDAVSLDELADLLSSTIEGGIIVSRVFRDKMVLPQHIRQYRNYIRLMFRDGP
jgi:TetR/AcrR family transcriptional regulator, transcriptional repressor for nem operon